MNIFNRYPYLIADIDVNFYDIAEKEGMSDMAAAKFMIDEAKECGIDAVKFQSFKTETLISKNYPNDLKLSETPASYKKFDKFGVGEYRELAEYCQQVGIKHIASKNKPIILSTGAATLNEIKQAVNAIEEVSTVDIAIMHSVSSYPTEYEDANLLMIKDLVKNFPGYEIGYSDNTKPDKDMVVLTTAYNYGARILEKPFTIDKNLSGNAHCYSMDPDDVIKLKWNLLFLSKINGMRNKQPVICESSSRRYARRSIVAIRDIKKGEVIASEDLTFKRPGTGISPSRIGEIIGKTVKEDILEDTLLDFDMVE